MRKAVDIVDCRRNVNQREMEIERQGGGRKEGGEREGGERQVGRGRKTERDREE